MATLIFDIETVGDRWEELDEITKGVLTRWIERTARNLEEKKALLSDAESGLGFSPLTGSVIAIGLYDLEREKGVVYYTGEGNEVDEVVGSYTFKQRRLIHPEDQHADSCVVVTGTGLPSDF